MLFDSQREELTGKQFTLYLTAAAHHPTKGIAFVTGVRSREKPYVIIANVEYISASGESSQAFNSELSPAKFEEFLNTFAMKVAQASGGKHRLTEINHHFKSLDDYKFMDLSDEEKQAALYIYLSAMIDGASNKEAAQVAGKQIKKFITQHN